MPAWPASPQNWQAAAWSMNLNMKRASAARTGRLSHIDLGIRTAARRTRRRRTSTRTGKSSAGPCYFLRHRLYKSHLPKVRARRSACELYPLAGGGYAVSLVFTVSRRLPGSRPVPPETSPAAGLWQNEVISRQENRHDRLHHACFPRHPRLRDAAGFGKTVPPLSGKQPRGNWTAARRRKRISPARHAILSGLAEARRAVPTTRPMRPQPSFPSDTQLSSAATGAAGSNSGRCSRHHQAETPLPPS